MSSVMGGCPAWMEDKAEVWTMETQPDWTKANMHLMISQKIKCIYQLIPIHVCTLNFCTV